MNKIVQYKIFNRKNNIIGVILLLILLCTHSEYGYSATPNQFHIAQIIQQKKITLSIQNKSAKYILSEMQRITGLEFVLQSNSNDHSIASLSINVKDVTIEQALKQLFEKTDYTYQIIDDIITIVKKKESSIKSSKVEVKGCVVDGNNKPLAGVTVIVLGTSNGAITDDKGNFVLQATIGQDIEVSCVGMKTAIKKITASSSNMVIKLEDDALAVEDVVVTGIYSRKKESFTGSSQTYSAKNLKSIGNQNVLQSLSTLDPSFAIMKNNQYGSNPNRLPEVEVRGKTSIIGVEQEYGSNLNQPLFILDGFESTLEVINDLSMDMIENITILKDASATAIYGSKAANGVVVVETRRPASGKLRVSYNGNFSLNFADLSDYNLMNSSEKLQFELLSGYYGKLDSFGEIADAVQAQKYNSRKADVARGVDTYWMDLPLRTGFTHKHTLFAEGGDDQMRYGIGFSYGNDQGVMTGSDRETINGNVRLMYKKGDVLFTNYTNIDYKRSDMEKVAFSEFSRTNPYYRKYNEDGEVEKALEEFVGSDKRTSYVYNPEYNRSLGSFYNRATFGFRNNFEIEWQIIDGLRARGRFSIAKSSLSSENFKSPFHTDFEGTSQLKKGKYDETSGRDLSYDGDFNITYGKELKGGHNINAVVGFRMSEKSLRESGYSAYGFIDDEYSNPAFSTGYPDYSPKPKFNDGVVRAASYYFNGGYSYKNRYMVDLNLRSDGSSVFGVENTFTTTWAVGLAWNVHNEKFMSNVKWLNELKVRASMGNPGNQNFDSKIAMRTYRYNNDLQNPFGLSAIVDVFGNSDLEWQKTIDKNIGIDLLVWDSRVKFSVDVFRKETDPLLVYVGVSSSTGSTKVPRNMGRQVGDGVTAAINFMALKKDNMSWSVNLNGRYLKSEYDGLGIVMNGSNIENRSRSFMRYYDGASATALWSVPSAGIDPITGRELFVKKDGTRSFVYDYNDEVVVGNSTPDFEGVIGTSFYYKGFTASINFRYSLGGDVFMESLYKKVENISKSSLQYNQDKRALSDRWQNPGDKAKYKSISLTDNTPMSSRFVKKENMISAESISLGYETQASWLRRIGASSMTFKAYMNDIFRVSTVKNERGIDYPFARSVSFSLGLRF